MCAITLTAMTSHGVRTTDDVPETGPLLLGIDLGATTVAATLVSPARGIVARTSREVTLHRDVLGWAEVDPGEWWRASSEVIARLLAHAGASNADVAALAVSGGAPAVVICDARGVPLRRAILESDVRATHEVRELQRTLEHLDLLQLTGSVLSQQSVAPTILWVARNEPALWARAASVQGSYDWLARQFGASLHVEQNWALESGLYDLELHPLTAVLATTEVAWPAMSPVRRSGTVVGEVTRGAARSSGLRAGTPIVVGGASHVLSAYGAGLVRAGDALITLAEAGDIIAVSPTVFFDHRLYLDAHPMPGAWLPHGSMATSGSLLRWEQTLFEGAPLEGLDAAARASRPGALVTLPYFLGERTPRHDPDLRGLIAGLHLGTTRGDLHRSLLEGIAYGFKVHVDVLAEGGLVLGDVRVTSSGPWSRLWREILADVLHRDLVSLVDHPGASYGAAVVAGIGVGLISDWAYVQGARANSEVISPHPENVAVYQERYQQFLQLSLASTSISHSLARDPE